MFGSTGLYKCILPVGLTCSVLKLKSYHSSKLSRRFMLLNMWNASIALAATRPIPTATFFKQTALLAARQRAPAMCSGRNPFPTTRPSRSFTPGMFTATFSCHGAFAGPRRSLRTCRCVAIPMVLGLIHTNGNPFWDLSRLENSLQRARLSVHLNLDNDSLKFYSRFVIRLEMPSIAFIISNLQAN
jgi:hypothetical protein